MNPFRTGSVHAYQQIGLETGIGSASPHQLVLMLFDGMLTAIGDARQHMKTRNTAAKGAATSKAIRIVSEGLRASLDMDRGGDIARQLYDLYDYMGSRLVEANLKNSQEILAEVSALVCELRTAWVQIGAHTVPKTASSPVPMPQGDRRAVSYGVL